jgi:hypothetical protein
MQEYFEGHPCVDCGEGVSTVFEFDHVRGSKTDDVSAIQKGFG